MPLFDIIFKKLFFPVFEQFCSCENKNSRYKLFVEYRMIDQIWAAMFLLSDMKMIIVILDVSCVALIIPFYNMTVQLPDATESAAWKSLFEATNLFSY